MSVTLYDNALLKKLQGWTRDTAITLTGVDESTRLFSSIIDQKNDKPIQLPLIALSRPGGYTLLRRYKHPRTHNGLRFIQTKDKGVQLNIIPIEIKYQLDIYARYLEEADEYARNIVFNIVNYPKLTIEIPYEGSKLVHDANIRLQSEVEDNSDIPERLVSGQFVRLTMGLNIDDAYLFDVRLKDNISIVEVCTQAENLPRELVFDDFYKKN